MLKMHLKNAIKVIFYIMENVKARKKNKNKKYINSKGFSPLMNVLKAREILELPENYNEELLKKMVTLLNQNRKENWVDLHNMRIIKYGPVLHLDAHITIPWYLNVHEAHHEIDALAALVRKEFGETLELYVHSDGCLDFSCHICQKEDCTVRKHPFQKKIEWSIQNISSDQKHRINI